MAGRLNLAILLLAAIVSMTRTLAHDEERQEEAKEGRNAFLEKRKPNF